MKAPVKKIKTRAQLEKTLLWLFVNKIPNKPTTEEVAEYKKEMKLSSYEVLSAVYRNCLDKSARRIMASMKKNTVTK